MTTSRKNLQPRNDAGFISAFQRFSLSEF